MKLAEDPDRFLSTIQIGITLIGILTGLYSGAAIADEVGAQLQQWGLQPRLAHTTGQILIVAAVTYLSIVVGELVPKRIGLAAANSVAKVVSRPMHLLSVAAMPLVWLLSVSTAFFVKVLGLKKNVCFHGGRRCSAWTFVPISKRSPTWKKSRSKESELQ